MPHTALEDHLEEHCPICGEKHKSDWKAQFERDLMYIITKCISCEYTIFKKRDFTSCGTFLEML